MFFRRAVFFGAAAVAAAGCAVAPVAPSDFVTNPKPTTTTAAPAPPAAYYENCAEVRAAGRAPLHRDDPGYRAGLDRDGDGWACDVEG